MAKLSNEDILNAIADMSVMDVVCLLYTSPSPRD